MILSKTEWLKVKPERNIDNEYINNFLFYEGLYCVDDDNRYYLQDEINQELEGDKAFQEYYGMSKEDILNRNSLPPLNHVKTIMLFNIDRVAEEEEDWEFFDLCIPAPIYFLEERNIKENWEFFIKAADNYKTLITFTLAFEDFDDEAPDRKSIELYDGLIISYESFLNEFSMSNQLKRCIYEDLSLILIDSSLFSFSELRFLMLSNKGDEAWFCDDDYFATHPIIKEEEIELKEKTLIEDPNIIIDWLIENNQKNYQFHLSYPAENEFLIMLSILSSSGEFPILEKDEFSSENTGALIDDKHIVGLVFNDFDLIYNIKEKLSSDFEDIGPNKLLINALKRIENLKELKELYLSSEFGKIDLLYELSPYLIQLPNLERIYMNNINHHLKFEAITPSFLSKFQISLKEDEKIRHLIHFLFAGVYGLELLPFDIYEHFTINAKNPFTNQESYKTNIIVINLDTPPTIMNSGDNIWFSGFLVNYLFTKNPNILWVSEKLGIMFRTNYRFLSVYRGKGPRNEEERVSSVEKFRKLKENHPHSSIQFNMNSMELFVEILKPHNQNRILQSPWKEDLIEYWIYEEHGWKNVYSNFSPKEIDYRNDFLQSKKKFQSESLPSSPSHPIQLATAFGLIDQLNTFQDQIIEPLEPTEKNNYIEKFLMEIRKISRLTRRYKIQENASKLLVDIFPSEPDYLISHAIFLLTTKKYSKEEELKKKADENLNCRDCQAFLEKYTRDLSQVNIEQKNQMRLGEIYVILAICMYKTNNIPAGNEFLEKILPLDSQKVEKLLRRLISIFRKQKGNDWIVPFLKTSLRFIKNQGSLYNTLGDVLLTKEKYDEALVYLDKGRDLYPKHEYLWITTGEVYLALSKLDTAKKMFMQAFEFDPNNSITKKFLKRIEEAENEEKLK